MLKKAFSKTKPVCKVTFSLPVEAVQGGKEVRILGDFNDWSWENGYKMKASKAEFSTEVELEAGKEYQFRYLIDNHIWENDWKADKYVAAPFGVFNSVISLVETKATNGNGTKAATAKATTDKATPAAKSAVKPAAKAAPAAKTAKTTTAKTTADDLTKIEGVGPKIAELLKKAGIVTFADLAAAKVDKIKGILEAAGKRYQMHDPSTWAQQATLASKGDWAKLEKLQGELKGGKR
jgi:predicted flap endonuclease-1-like 5' DNA nuclease